MRDRAEARKLELEASLLARKLREPWYKGRYFVQSIVGGVVCAGLLATWGVGYFSPLMNKKQELAQLESRRRELLVQIQEVKNERERQALVSVMDAARLEVAELARQNQGLDSQLTSVEGLLTSVRNAIADKSTAADSSAILFADARSQIDENLALIRTARQESAARKEGLNWWLNPDRKVRAHFICAYTQRSLTNVVVEQPVEQRAESLRSGPTNFIEIPVSWGAFRIVSILGEPFDTTLRIDTATAPDITVSCGQEIVVVAAARSQIDSRGGPGT